MKKLLVILLVIFSILALSSCEIIDENFPAITKPLGLHNCKFVIDEEASTPATCEKAGLEVLVCACGETKKNELEPLGHDKKMISQTPQKSCDSYGSITYKCLRCSKSIFESIKPIEHIWAEPEENSRLVRCTREGCKGGKLVDPLGTYAEDLVFDFSEADEAALEAKHAEVLAALEAAAKYDATLHAYAEEGDLADAYEAIDALHTEYYDLIMNAASQRQLAEVFYYCDMKDEELEELYSYMLDYYTNLIAKFYTLSQPFYDSCYREFYYYGMSEEEINAYLFESNVISNPEYTALKERNNAIEVEMLALSSAQAMAGDTVPNLYAEFVENNNKMAALMGYENYLEYAYENVYGRDYTYQDVAKVTQYVKNSIAGLFNSTYGKWNTIISSFTEKDQDKLYEQINDSFFTNLVPNTTFNDYIDLLVFSTNPDKNISFSDELNKLMVDGNLFRGDYEGAFVTSIKDIPIAYFGRGYQNAFTVAHEFGHFMNEVYSAGTDANQSYDLLEMHSQGNEMLYLYFLKSQMGDGYDYDVLVTYQFLNMLNTIMSGLAVDAFEQAIYLDNYVGTSASATEEGKTNAEVIMADGTITPDEYDLLYKSIIADFGTSAYQSSNYWRYGMTITSPCYYVSYSISAISVLQFYEMAANDGMDAAIDSYLKIFSYVDENPDMTMAEVFEYAGLYYYTDEALYSTFAPFYTANILNK